MNDEQSKSVSIIRSTPETTRNGPTDYFTGDVKIAAPFGPDDPSRVQGATVSFEKGARTAWHTHPFGQLLIVTAGSGYVQKQGDDAQPMHQGDIVWIPAHVKHWHGAAPDTPMTHVAVQEHLDGTAVEWLEKVTDEEYGQ
ncbi:MAG: cupin domain-containing protein [Deltaproteobacteria bacterium]|nr:cupin domain-containing protein [Deltaproteobacteria bacterium]